MDQIDLAQRVEEELRLESLLKLRAMHTDEEVQWVDPNRGQVLCLDCEAPIPKARLAANPKAVRCIECQREQDRIQRHESRLYAGPDRREEPAAAIFRAGQASAERAAELDFDPVGDTGAPAPARPIIPVRGTGREDFVSDGDEHAALPHGSFAVSPVSGGADDSADEE